MFKAALLLSSLVRWFRTKVTGFVVSVLVYTRVNSRIYDNRNTGPSASIERGGCQSIFD